MTMKSTITIIVFCTCSVSAAFAEQAEVQMKITVPSLSRVVTPITLPSDSKFVKEHLLKHKLRQPVRSRTQASHRSANAINERVKKRVSNSSDKKSNEPVLIQLEVPEQLQEVVNTGKSFVFQDITLRGEKVAGTADGLDKRKKPLSRYDRRR